MLWPKASPLDLDFGLCAWAKLFNFNSNPSRADPHTLDYQYTMNTPRAEVHLPHCTPDGGGGEVHQIYCIILYFLFLNRIPTFLDPQIGGIV